jgi:hypothetical protein
MLSAEEKQVWNKQAKGDNYFESNVSHDKAEQEEEKLTAEEAKPPAKTLEPAEEKQPLKRQRTVTPLSYYINVNIMSTGKNINWK